MAELTDALEHATEELEIARRLIFQGSIGSSKGRGSSLLQTTRRLQEDVKQLQADKAVSRYRQLQRDLAESDTVNAALRKVLSLAVGWQDARIDQHIDEQVLRGERLYGASRELLMRENRRLRACLSQAQALYSSGRQHATTSQQQHEDEGDLVGLGEQADDQLHGSTGRRGQSTSGRCNSNSKSRDNSGNREGGTLKAEGPPVWEELAQRVQEAMHSVQRASAAAADHQKHWQHPQPAIAPIWVDATASGPAADLADAGIQVELPVHSEELQLLHEEVEVLKAANERMQHKLSWHEAQEELRAQETALAVQQATESEPAAAALHKQLSGVQHEVSALLQEVRQLQGATRAESQTQAKELKQALADATSTMAKHLEQLSRQAPAVQAQRPSTPQQTRPAAEDDEAHRRRVAQAAAEAAHVELLAVQKAALAASEGERRQLQRQLVARATLSRIEDGKQQHVQRALLEGVSHALRESVAEHCDALHAHLQQLEQQISVMQRPGQHTAGVAVDGTAGVSLPGHTAVEASDAASALLEDSRQLRARLHTLMAEQEPL